MAPNKIYKNLKNELVLKSETNIIMSINRLTNVINMPKVSSSYTRCCIPRLECLHLNKSITFKNKNYTNDNNNDNSWISLFDLRDTIRVICTNEFCDVGRYMHRECFENWEQSILSYLKISGKAKMWSERQRQQNLWTEKGFEIILNVCICKCNQGSIRKDLNWIPPPPTSNIFHQFNDFDFNNTNNTSIDIISSDAKNEPEKFHNKQIICPIFSPDNKSETQKNSLASINKEETIKSSVLSQSSKSPTTATSKHGKNKLIDRIKAESETSSIFYKRHDLSMFNSLPKTKINSHYIKMEDDGNHATDEIRCFVLSTLASKNTSQMKCILCTKTLLVYDKYPLIDGTFFLTPRQYSSTCIQVKVKNLIQYLSCVCMFCLQATSLDRIIYCQFCYSSWDGSSFIIGSMYSYDIFAAIQCCEERLKCNVCRKSLLHPQIRLNYFSDYSHVIPCLHCRRLDTHFVKPLFEVFTKPRILQNCQSS